MKNYFEILPHTADVRLRAVGETLEGLFEQAVLGMAQILKSDAKFVCLPASGGNDAKKEKIDLSASDETTLLIDFLNEILTRSYINKCVYKVSSFKIHDSSLKAELAGAKVDNFDEDIKAVTYHEAKITKNPEGSFEATVIFDI